MLNRIEDLGEDVVGFEAEGVVTAKDYEEHLVPAIEHVIESGVQPRLLYVLGPSFERFDIGAAFADAKVGLSHFSDFERIAVVTDRDWIEHAVRAFGVLTPSPVRTFEYESLDDAKAWVSDHIKNEFQLEVERDGDTAHIHVKLQGSLDRKAEDELISAVKAGIGDAAEVRVLVEASDFHGWSDLRALWQHIRFIAGQRAKLERVAIVGDRTWQRRLAASAKHILRLEARFFDEGKLREAQAWLKG